MICVIDIDCTNNTNLVLADCSGFKGYKSVCRATPWSGKDTCAFQVETKKGHCSTYCKSQGSWCVKAQDNKGDGCKRDLSHKEGCDKKWKVQICVCKSRSTGNSIIHSEVIG